MKRIAYVLKMYPRFSETFVLNELLELERQGAELRVFSLKRPNDGIAHADVERLRANVTYVPESLPGLVASQASMLARAPRRYLRLLVEVLRRRRASSLKHFLQAGAIAPHVDGQADHVHAHFASGATSVALYVERLTGAPYSFTAHAKDIYLETVRPGDLRRKLERARFAVTVSDFNSSYLKPYDPGGRVVRIYNGVDLGAFSVDGRRRDRPPLILAVGRLIEKKGFDDLIRACAILEEEGREFRCRIVGKGLLAAELGALIRSLGLEDRVELAGPVPGERLRELYPRASALAVPCVVGRDGNRDGLPTVLIEAMALGVPVVATDVTGIPELVEDGVTGLVVPERDPAELARALGTILDDPSSAEERARAGRERVERQFDLRRNVGELLRLFEGAPR